MIFGDNGVKYEYKYMDKKVETSASETLL
jgi:hypothetical protein